MASTQSAWRSPWVIGFILMAVIIIAANVYLIWIAGNRAPSLVAENYYERGQDYEKNMLKRMAQDPGWNMELVAPEKLVLNQPGEFAFTLFDQQGKVVNPDAVVLHVYRPSDAGADFDVPMTKLSAGHYRAALVFPLKGVWDLLASVKVGDKEFNVSQRINVSAN